MKLGSPRSGLASSTVKPTSENARAGAVAGRPEIIFDRDGDAVERAERLAGPHRPLGRAGFAESSLGVHHDIGDQACVRPLDSLQHGAGDLDRRQHPVTDQFRQLDGGGEAEIGGVQVSVARRGGPLRDAAP